MWFREKWCASFLTLNPDTTREQRWLFVPKRVSFFNLAHVCKIRMGLAPAYMAAGFCAKSNVHGHDTRGSDVDYHIGPKIPTNSFAYSAIKE
jgi:hypothetical protein